MLKSWKWFWHPVKDCAKVKTVLSTWVSRFNFVLYFLDNWSFLLTEKLKEIIKGRNFTVNNLTKWRKISTIILDTEVDKCFSIYHTHTHKKLIFGNLPKNSRKINSWRVSLSLATWSEVNRWVITSEPAHRRALKAQYSPVRCAWSAFRLDLVLITCDQPIAIGFRVMAVLLSG